MTTKLAYQVSYTTDYRSGRVEAHDMHTRYFATREYAVAHARYLTNDATEHNGVFVSEWMNPFAGMLNPDDSEEIRVTATVETVTVQEVADSLE